MDILSIIERKKTAKELTKEEIDYFIQNYTVGNITDYQAAALIMAICINGMTAEEIGNLTMSMAKSGDVLDLSDVAPNTVDKHSTGGVGDKVTLILMPIVACLGAPVAKMSGRGLGITGGTADKLQSIPGYRTDIDIEEFKNNVREVGISLISSSLNLAPADKKIYALRDCIACTNSIPLIASSIMSKKIAAGAEHILLDVTCGSGAFMTKKEDAKKLAKMMSLIGKWTNKDVNCVITSMEEPLGYTVGNSLEVIEAVKALKGEMADDVREIVLYMGAKLLELAGLGANLKENKEKILEVLENGKAFEKFKEVVIRQNGDASYLDDLNKFEKAPFIMPIIADRAGYVEKLDARTIGEISVELGVGRKRKEDDVDHRTGIVFNKKIGDKVEKGDILAYVHANNEQIAIWAVEEIEEKAYKIVSNKVTKRNVILAVDV